LYGLGLRRAPPLDVLLQLAAGTDEAVRGKALRFFLDDKTRAYDDYRPQDWSTLAFVPVRDKDGKQVLRKPMEVSYDLVL
jgi:hypothetical protein